jgi:hypothetical protein
VNKSRSPAVSSEKVLGVRVSRGIFNAKRYSKGSQIPFMALETSTKVVGWILVQAS